MMEGLQDIIGVLTILGLLLLLRRILFPSKPPTKHQARTRRVPGKPPKSPTG
jgi:hypothetical protein